MGFVARRFEKIKKNRPTLVQCFPVVAMLITGLPWSLIRPISLNTIAFSVGCVELLPWWAIFGAWLRLWFALAGFRLEDFVVLTIFLRLLALTEAFLVI